MGGKKQRLTDEQKRRVGHTSTLYLLSSAFLGKMLGLGFFIPHNLATHVFIRKNFSEVTDTRRKTTSASGEQ